MLALFRLCHVCLRNVGGFKLLGVFDYLHQVHVVQGHVVELNVLYDGGGAGVVGSIDEG